MQSYDFDNPYPSFPYNEDLAELIRENGIKESYPPNKTIISPGADEAFYYIKKGRARIVLNSADGKEQILAILGENALIGAPTMMSKENVNYSIITEIPSVLYKLGKTAFWQLYKGSDLFKEAILNNITENYFRLMHQMEFQTFKSCKERLYELLFISIDENAPSEKNWYKLVRQYPQSVLAKIIGANRFTVTRLFHELSEEGKIRVVNNIVEVKIDNPK